MKNYIKIIGFFGFTLFSNFAFSQINFAFNTTNNSQEIGVRNRVLTFGQISGGQIEYPTKYRMGVGVANPEEMLHVNQRIRSNSLSGIGTRFLGADLDGTIIPYTFSGNSNLFLNGNGDFTTIPNGSDADWFQSGTTNSPTNINQPIYSLGSVSIGTNNAITNRVFNVTGSVQFDVNQAGDGASRFHFNRQNNTQEAFISFNTANGYNWLFGLDNVNNNDFFLFRAGSATTLRILENNGNLGIGNFTGTTIPSQRLDVIGNARIRQISSTLTGGNDLWADANGVLRRASSDRRLKTNITNMSSTLEKVLSLNGYKYDWKENQNAEKKDIGLIAQEVEEVFPELVFTNEVDGFKGINYSRFSAVFVEAIKEQQLLINEQNAKIKNLENVINKLNSNESKIDASNLFNNAVLYQNVPNPFNQQTIIKYDLPEIYTSAKIHIYNLNGQEIKEYDLTITENKEIIIQANELKAGMYYYSLIIDNQEIDTKRMILVN